MVCSCYSTVGQMKNCYSECRGFEPVSGTLIFVDIKISNKNNAACCSRALLATLSCFIFLCVWGMKMLILLIKRVSSKMGQNFCMFKGPLEALE